MGGRALSLFSGKRRPLHLHIGLGDTGTQALQRTLFAQRDALAAQGLVVPSAGVQREGHHELAWQLGFARGRPPAASQSPEQIVAAWHEEISRHKGAAGLVSSEYFSLPGQHAALHALLEPRFDVQVIVYLHRHDLWMPFVWGRAVRGTTQPPWGRGYEAFVSWRKNHEARADRFRAIVDDWAKAFGKEQVVVRPFEASQIGDHIAADLLRTIGAPAAAVDAVLRGAVAGDAPPSLELLHLMDIVQHTALPPALKRQVVHHHAARDPGRLPGTQIASPGFRSGQVAAHFDDYEYIAQRFLGRRDGRLFLDPTPTDEAAGWKAPNPFTQMWLVERVCEALGGGGADTWELLQGLPGAAR